MTFFGRCQPNSGGCELEKGQVVFFFLMDSCVSESSSTRIAHIFTKKHGNTHLEAKVFQTQKILKVCLNAAHLLKPF